MADIQLRSPRKTLASGMNARRVVSALARSLATVKPAASRRGPAQIARAKSIAERRARPR